MARKILYVKATEAVLRNGGYISTSPISGRGTAFDCNGNSVGSVEWRTTNTLIDKLNLACKTNAGGFGWDHFVMRDIAN